MADTVNYDSIALDISSDSTQAEQSVERLATSLLGLNKALGKIGQNAGNVRAAAKSLAAMADIKFPDLTKVISDFERLSNIKFDNLRNKDLKLKFQVSGLDEKERVKLAVDDVAAYADKRSKEVGRSLGEMFHLDGNQVRSITRLVDSMMRDINKGGGLFEFGKINEQLKNVGSVTKAELARATDDVSGSLEQEYREFIDYVKAHPIASSDIMGEMGNKGLKEDWYKSGLGQFVSKNGLHLDMGYFQDLIQLFPRAMSGFHDLASETAAYRDDVNGMADAVGQAIRNARAYLKTPIQTSETEQYVEQTMASLYDTLAREVDAAISDSMKKSATQIPVEMTINEDRLIAQVQKAVDAIRKTDYGNINLKLGIDTSALKADFASAFGKGDAQQLGELTTALSEMLNVMTGFKDANLKESGLAATVNALKNLARVDSSKLDVSLFNEVASAIERMSFVEGDTLSNITAFIKAIISLSRASEKLKTTIEVFPQFSDQMESFFTRMAYLPTISENTVRMAEAMAQMARSGRRAGYAMYDFSKASKSAVQTSNSYKDASKFVNMFGDSVKSALSLIKKLGGASLSGIKKLTGAFQSLGQKGAQGIRTLISRLKEMKNHTNGVHKLTLSLKNLLRVAIGFRGLYGVFNWLKEAVSSGADVAETNHIVEETFHELTDDVKGWASDAIDKYGIAANAAKRYAGTMSAMFQASGIGYKEAAKMSTDLVGLAGDLSSFYNIDTEKAFSKIRSGIAGQVRPLRELGIDLTVATLREYALSQGITKSWTAMSQAEKVMLRYNYLMSVTSKQQGDFERTSLSMANSMRVFRAYAAAIADTVGEGLVAALRHAVHGLNFLMKKVLQAAAVFKSFMQTLFGANISGGGFTLDTSDLEDASGYADDLSDSVGNASDGLSGAADNAEKLKKDLSLLPFDELNQLNKDQESASSSSPSGGGGGIGGLGDMGELSDLGWLDQLTDRFNHDGLPDAINKWAEKIKAAFKAHAWRSLGKIVADGINEGLQKLYDILDPETVKAKVDPWINAFATTFNSLIKYLNFDLIGRTIGRGLNDILHIINTTLESIDWINLGRQLANGLNGLVDELDFGAVADFFANRLNVLWQTAYGFVTTFKWGKLGVELANGAWEFVQHIDWDSIVGTLNKGLEGLARAVKGFALTFPWKKAGDLLVAHVNDFITGFPAEQIGEAVGEAMKGIEELVLAITDPETGINFELLGGKLALGLKRMVEIGLDPNFVGPLISNLWNDAWKMLDSFINGLKNDSGKGTFIGTTIRDTIANIVEGIQVEDMASAISTFVNNVAQDIQLIFGQTQTWATLGLKVGNGISAVLKGINSKDIADAINAVSSALLEFFKNAFDGIDWTDAQDKIRETFERIEWGNIFKLLAPLVAVKFAGSVVTWFATDVIKNAFKIHFTKMITAALPGAISGATASTEVSEAAQLAGKTIGEGIGAGLAEGGALFAAVELGKKLQEAMELFRGGNGILSEQGGAIDSYIDKMSEAYGITGETYDKLFKLKEEWEDTGDTETFITEFSKTLSEANISTETANKLVKDLQGELGNLTDEQVKFISDALSEMVDNTEEATISIEELNGANGGDALKTLRDAITSAGWEMQNLDGVADGVYDTSQTVAEALVNAVKQGYDLSSTLGNLVADWNLNEEAVEVLRQKIDEAFNTPGMFDLLMGDAKTAIATMESLGETPATIKQTIDTYLGEGTYDSLIAATESATGKTDSLKSDIEETGKSAQDSLGKVETYNEEANKTPSIFDTIGTLIKGWASNLLSAWATKEETKAATEQFGSGAAEGIEDSMPEAVEAAETGAENIIDALPSKEDTKEVGIDSIDGYVEGVEEKTPDAVNATEGFSQDAIDAARLILDEHSPSRVFDEIGENVVLGFAEGVEGNVESARASITTLFDAIREETDSALDDLKSAFNTGGYDAVVYGFAEGISTGFEGISLSGYVVDLATSFSNTVESEKWLFENAGYKIVSAIQSGLNSINLQLPYISVGWDTYTYGNGGWFELPYFNVHWAKKGGLFSDPRLIGIGEAGEEAVLPLTDKRAMARIADAITENSSGVGIDQNALVAAFVQAQQITSQNNPQRDPIFEITVKTESDEVLARAVQRGNNSINYRSNSKPQYGY